jgi:hypothetical protein
MTFPKVLALLAVFLFGSVVVIAFFKESKESTAIVATNTPSPTNVSSPIEVKLDRNIQVISTASSSPSPSSSQRQEEKKPEIQNQPSVSNPIAQVDSPKPVEIPIPNVNRIEELFNKGDPKLPIVETITYKSRVSWQKGRPAWLSDYANHYQTSRHFIARSLNGKPDYFKQDLAEGERFNVLRKDKNFRFYLAVDLSRCKMWFYYDDLDVNQRVLLKVYSVGLGRIDETAASGMLTPIGKYSLGNKIAIYKPKMIGPYHGKQIEMIGVFGSRWIPFEKEVSDCSLPAKGFGLHGMPWALTATGERVEDRSSLGKHASDGCIRLASEDIEELFAIIITKPTLIELVKHYNDTGSTKILRD